MTAVANQVCTNKDVRYLLHPVTLAGLLSSSSSLRQPTLCEDESKVVPFRLFAYAECQAVDILIHPSGII